MKIRRLDHVGIRVMDFGRSIRFYKQLGFELAREDLQEHVVVMKHPGGIVKVTFFYNLFGGE